MPELGFLPVVFKLSLGKIRASKFSIVAAVLFPVFLVWLGLAGRPATAMSVFLFFFPHAFLFLAQDMVKTEIESGAMENVLFLGGRFRAYIWQKNFVIMAAGTVYAAVIFAALAAWNSVSGFFDWNNLVGFAAGLLAGYYYVAVAGLLSYYLRSGSNMLVFIFLQLAIFIGTMVSITSRSGLLSYIEGSQAPDLKSRLIIGALVTAFPNLIVFAQVRNLWWQVMILGLTGFAVQKCLSRRLELKR